MTWLTTPPSDRVPGTQTELADELSVTPSTLINWMKNDQFKQDWRQQAHNILGEDHQTRVKNLLDHLYVQAMDTTNRSSTTAAKLYFEVTKAIQPKRRMIADPEKLSDEELERLLSGNDPAEEAAIERASEMLDESWRDDESGCPWPDDD